MKTTNKILLTAAVLALAAAPTLATAGSCGSHAAKQASAEKATMSIYATAQEAGFTTLAAAVKAAGLDEVLANDGPFTVFAPTDEAFAKLPEGTVESLLQDIEALTAILTYHVVPGKVMAADVVGLSEAATVNGASIDIAVDGDVVKINDATVTAADIAASNGVIHVIDTVILPPAN